MLSDDALTLPDDPTTGEADLWLPPEVEALAELPDAE
jgi:hypothetical protein